MIFSDKPDGIVSYKSYKKGFCLGCLPIFHEFETANCSINFRNTDFKNGFISGRFVYEQLNGKLTNKLPEEILTLEIVYKIYVDGLMSTPAPLTTKYTKHQQNNVKYYYELGKAHSNQNTSLNRFLEQLQITTL